MQRDPKKKLIDLTRSWELNRWCEELGLRAEDLRNLVRRFGHDPEVIRRILRQSRRDH